MYEIRCPICLSTASFAPSNFSYDWYVNCTNCKKFFFENGLAKDPNQDVLIWDQKLRSCAFYYITHYSIPQVFPAFVVDEASLNENVKERNRKIVSTSYLFSLYPQTFAERIDKVLLTLSKLYPKVSEKIIWNYDDNQDLITNNLDLIFFCDNNAATKNAEEIKYIVGQMILAGYFTGSFDNFQITAKGWERIYELELQNTITNQAFVAMRFSDDTRELREAIRHAIQACGYQAVIIDEKDYNGQIVPEMLACIRQSLFLVAEYTEPCDGVYYESGYAEALEKEVIHTCQIDKINNLHFDIKQKNTVLWKDKDDLYERLTLRISATIGNLNPRLQIDWEKRKVIQA